MAANRASRLAVTAAIVVACVAVVASPRDRQRGFTPPSFQERVADYVTLHQEFARRLTARGIEPSAGFAFRYALAAAIREARHGARPGDMFCDSVAPAIRGTVRAYFATQPPSLWTELLAEMPPARPLRVNDSYPEGEPLASMPATLLQRLDPLPEELQYRFFNDSLILLDVDAGLIVDLLGGALPSDT
jgi:hypothetical protein